MATLRKTKQCVTGLEDLTDAHSPGNDYSDPAVKIGKLQHADKPESSSTSASRPLDCICWETLGAMHYKSHHGHSYATIFTCALQNIHGCTITLLQLIFPLSWKRFHAGTSVLREKHGPILRMRRDDASVDAF